MPHLPVLTERGRWKGGPEVSLIVGDVRGGVLMNWGALSGGVPASESFGYQPHVLRGRNDALPALRALPQVRYSDTVLSFLFVLCIISVEAGPLRQ